MPRSCGRMEQCRSGKEVRVASAPRARVRGTLVLKGVGGRLLQHVLQGVSDSLREYSRLEYFKNRRM